MGEMAVRQRILNSTAPFSGPPQTELKGSYSSCPTPDKGTEEGNWKEGKTDFMACYNPILNKLLTQGTAEQVGEGPLKTSTFIAQAECETLDSQEFSPSCSASFVPSPNCFTRSLSSEPNNVACPLNACFQEPDSSLVQQAPRRKARKRQKRKEKKKEEKRVKQRQRHRVPSGVPEQESGSQPASSQDDVSKGHSGRGVSGTYCSSNVQSSEVHDTGPPLYPQHVYSRNPSCAALGLGTLHCSPVSGLCSFGEQSSSDSSLSSVGDCTLAVAALRGSVSQADPCYAFPFFRDVERDEWGEEEEEEDLSECMSVPNEGIIFYHEDIQPVKYEYKEGKHYYTQFLKQGSFGEVYSAQDANTGFRFAAKKIPLKSFNSEEVGTWSVLSSPRIVKLFGVVREGPHIILLMDHKYGSLSQLITERGRLPEDLSLHYHCQILGALEYLVKKRVAHLDIKADNVLLSEDGRDTFLCDFGHAERLDSCGQSLSGSQDMKGTETHMAPEIVKGHPRGAKADVWSSCCMLLHMLNGRQPWTRYYTCRLYLKIANEPPPLREMPSDCGPLTVEVATAGLQKDPAKRASASALREKAARALKAVGGLTSSIRGPYAEPLSIENNPSCSPTTRSGPSEEGEDLVIWGETPTAGKTKNEPKHDEYVEEANAERKPGPDPPLSLQTLMCNEKNRKKGSSTTTTVSELELLKLERDFYLSSLSQLHSAEMQEQLLSCLSSDCHSNWDTWDKKDSGRWSISPGEDLSSGVFSYNSQPDGQVFSNDWLGHTQLPPPRCFEGVDICIKDFNRRSIQIREMRRVKVGHIATGISDQISQRVFTLETQEGQQVAHDEEVQDSGLQLCCVPAPDYSPAWRWRIRDGVLETRDRVHSSHTPSTLVCSFNEP